MPTKPMFETLSPMELASELQRMGFRLEISNDQIILAVNERGIRFSMCRNDLEWELRAMNSTPAK